MSELIKSSGFVSPGSTDAMTFLGLMLMVIRYMAEKRRKLNVQYNEDSSNKLLKYLDRPNLTSLCFYLLLLFFCFLFLCVALLPVHEITFFWIQIIFVALVCVFVEYNS